MFEAIHQMDLNILHFVRSFKAPELLTLATFFATLSWKGWVWWLVALGTWFKQRQFAAHLTVSLLLLIIFGLSIKGFIHRERPDAYAANMLGIPMPPTQELMVTVHSFPSGHTLLAAAFAISVYLYFGKVKGLLAAAIVLMIGWARIYQGVHWPTDIVGSVLLAIPGALGATWICKQPLVAKIIDQPLKFPAHLLNKQKASEKTPALK